MNYSNRPVTLHFNIATRRVYTGGLTEKRYHCTLVCMNIMKQYNVITSLKDVIRGCTEKSIFSGFIQTIWFAEKQHDFTLKALILQDCLT